MSHRAAPFPSPLLVPPSAGLSRAAEARLAPDTRAGLGSRLALAHVGIGLVALAVLCLAQAVRIIVRARLGQVTAARAWEDAPLGAGTPVARLRVPSLGIDEVVLAGGADDLAKGPRLLAGGEGAGAAVPLAAGGASQPLAAGVASPVVAPAVATAADLVIAGHRDLHFRFLRRLAVGDEVRLATPDGVERSYQVVGTEVLTASQAALLTAPTTAPGLTLLTHYPFDAVPPGGPLRYVVRAVALDPPPASSAGAG